MKKLTALIISASIWYSVTSFITWNIDIQTWHGLARLFFVVFTILTYEKIFDSINKK